MPDIDLPLVHDSLGQSRRTIEKSYLFFKRLQKRWVWEFTHEPSFFRFVSVATMTSKCEVEKANDRPVSSVSISSSTTNVSFALLPVFEWCHVLIGLTVNVCIESMIVEVWCIKCCFWSDNTKHKHIYIYI